jgi:hypothetical protein
MAMSSRVSASMSPIAATDTPNPGLLPLKVVFVLVPAVKVGPFPR